MGKRREARERAVQFLFQSDLNPPVKLRAELELFWQTQRLTAISERQRGPTWGQETEVPPPSAEETEVIDFAESLIRGVLQHQARLDEIIAVHAQNWSVQRMAVVDRNVLRLAIYEMLYREDIPPVVSINEAVEIAKKYSTEDSGKFVNGILDKVKSELLRPARAPCDQSQPP
jgi:N utilization substance protein B